MCDGGTLTRKENVSNPVPGSTYIEQDFVCYNDNGEPIKRLEHLCCDGHQVPGVYSVGLPAAVCTKSTLERHQRILLNMA